MPIWAWLSIGAIYTVGLGLLALALGWNRVAARLDKSMPVDDMVDIVSDDGPVPGCHCEDCAEPDMDEFELRAHMEYDTYRFGYRLPGERP